MVIKCCLYISLGLVVITGCTKDEIQNKASTLNHPERRASEYLQILEGIKLNYVEWARTVRQTSPDILGDITNDDILEDSLKFEDFRKRFYEQDYQFVKWLLNFEGDTTSSNLFALSMNPYSSYIEDCNMPMNNSNAALQLLFNFLEGEYLQCYRRNRNEPSWYDRQYRIVKTFLQQHKTEDIGELRAAWRRLLEAGVN